MDKQHDVQLKARAIDRAHNWALRATNFKDDLAAKLLSRTLKDPAGLQFTVAFVDGVIRPEDIKVAAHNLAKIGKQSPSFLPSYLRKPLEIGAKLAPLVPHIAVPNARLVFRQLVGDLVVDVSEKKLGPAIAKIRESGARININLLGEAVLGNKEAERRLHDTIELLRRDDVDYVSLKVSAVTGPHNPWAYDHVVKQAVEAILPLYEAANEYNPKKFVNLDMEEYRDLNLTIDVFTSILSQPHLHNLSAGIVLQTYLPDSLAAMQRLQKWAKERVDAGGAPIKVRVVKGANLSMELVDAEMHGWPLTTFSSKMETDANYIRVLDYAIRPEHVRNVRIGVAGMNLFTVGYAFELAKLRGVFVDPQIIERPEIKLAPGILDWAKQYGRPVEFEMLSGMASAQSKAASEDVGPMLYYVPVVKPTEYDVAIAYLVRRIEENAANQNFMSAVFELASNQDMWQREQNRFEAAYDHAFSGQITPNRTQSRLHETAQDVDPYKNPRHSLGKSTVDFVNTPDSDPALADNIQWAREITARIENSQLGLEINDQHTITEETKLIELIERTKAAGKEWAQKSAAERAGILHKVGVEIAKRRGEIIEVSASECGKTIDQADVEISEAVDFAHYYAKLAVELEEVAGAKFTPHSLTVVTPPWNFPVAIPAGSCLSALAAGSAVILKPAGPAKRTGAILAQAMWDAGVPKEVLALVQVGEKDLGKQLISHPAVDQVILTGSIDTAKLFRSWRSNLPLIAETSGKNSIIVTPSADLDLAVKDVVYSAFGHAGQKCSAASLVILVGSVARSKRFRNQLVDAVESLRVGWPTDISTQMGPITTPAEGKLIKGITVLEPGEHWVLEPKPIDASGRLWSPGVKAGVKPNSPYHLTEYFGPILGVMTAKNLDEAIALQNATDYGLTAGLHSLDATEINHWLKHTKAGNLYINRGITGAIVQRQPFGGWKLSAVGNGTKAGGPNYLFAMGTWKPCEKTAKQAVGADTSQFLYQTLQDAWQVANSMDDEKRKAQLFLALKLDEKAYNEVYAHPVDPSGLAVEKNYLGYVPTPVLVRAGEAATSWDVLRVMAAALTIYRGNGRALELSCGIELPLELTAYLSGYGVTVVSESDAEFLESVPFWAKDAGLDARIRLLGMDSDAVYAALDGSCDVAIWSNPVTYAGRLEMLPFVHEQSVSLTNHRFGNYTPLGEEVVFDPGAHKY